MSFFERIFGRKDTAQVERTYGEWQRQPSYPSAAPQSSDEQAIARYRYMLRTAPPETIEQAHEEAFAKLTPAQRAQVLRELNTQLPPGEQIHGAAAGDPHVLARMATRAELRRPGTIERSFGGMGGGLGGAALGMGGTILASLATGFVGSMVAQQFMEAFGDMGADEMLADVPAEEGDFAAEEMAGDFGGEF